MAKQLPSYGASPETAAADLEHYQSVGFRSIALAAGEQHGHALLFVQHGNDPLLTFKRYRCAYISLSGE